MDVHRILQSVESVQALDRPADVSARVADRVIRSTGVASALRGSWLGHPVHPLLITLPLGAWVTSLLFDVGFKDVNTARRLVAVGLAATPPTVMAGWADYPLLSVTQRRVGLVHAAFNAAAVSMFLVSYRLRRRERHRAATVFSVLGLLLVGIGGALGGHLSYAQGAGMFRWQPVRSVRHLRVTEPRRAA